MKKQTAMEELLDMLQVQNPLRNQMLEKEKQQIIETARYYFHEVGKLTPEQYYNQTFKQD